MKRPSAYYLLLIYIFAVCKPFLPVVSDVMSHTFWESGHLQTVHQHQGQNHLHQDLKEAAKQDATDANAGNVKSAESLSLHLFTQYYFDFSFSKVAVLKRFQGSCAVISIASDTLTPPPKA